MPARLALAALLLAGAGTIAAPASAATLVTNTGQTAHSVRILGSAYPQVANAFTTGDNATGYTLGGVDLVLSGVGAGDNLTVTIRVDSSGSPGAVHATLTNPTLGDGTKTFSATSGTTLDANTTYWVHLQRVGGSISLGTTSSDSEDSTPASGWSIANVGINWSSSQSRWINMGSGRSLRFTVDGTARKTAEPKVTKAEISGGTSLVITFDKTLAAASSLANSAFAVKKTPSGSTTAQAVSLSGTPTIADDTVTLTLASAAEPVDIVTVSYTKPVTDSNNRLEDGSGNEVKSFTDQRVAVAGIIERGKLVGRPVATAGDRSVTVSWKYRQGTEPVIQWLYSVARHETSEKRGGIFYAVPRVDWEDWTATPAIVWEPYHPGWLPIPGAVDSTRSHTFTHLPNGQRLENGYIYTFRIMATADECYYTRNTGTKENPVYLPESRFTRPCHTSGLAANWVTPMAGGGNAPPVLPDGPTAQATPGDGEVTLTWTAPEYAGTITGWELRWGEAGANGADPGWGAWTAIAEAVAETAEHTVTGLDNGTAYAFELRALAGETAGEASAAVTATPAAPAPPGPPELQAEAGDGEVTLVLLPPAYEGTLTGWEFRYGETGTGSTPAWGAWTAVEAALTESLAHTVTGLDNGTSYSFEARARAGSAAGAASEAVAATPAAAVPDPNGTRAEAVSLGAQSPSKGRQFFRGYALDRAAGDKIDYFTFTTDGRYELGLGVRDQSVELKVTIEAADGTTVGTAGPPKNPNKDQVYIEWLQQPLAAGTYYIRVEALADGATAYYLRFGLKAAPPAAPAVTDPDATRAGAVSLGAQSPSKGRQFFRGQSLDRANGDAVDYYRFTTDGRYTLGLGARDQSIELKVVLEDAAGAMVGIAGPPKNPNKDQVYIEWLQQTIGAGTYYIRVEALADGATDYYLRFGLATPPPVLSVADAEVEEGPGATLAFAVTLDKAWTQTVTVAYATSDGTATAGADYTATSGTLTFATGETAQTVSVPVLDDVHDEGAETLTLTLSSASGAAITDGTATGTIQNNDPLQQAWLARFGRTAATHVTDAVGERLRGAPGPASHLTIGGYRLPLGRPADQRRSPDGSEPAPQSLSPGGRGQGEGAEAERALAAKLWGPLSTDAAAEPPGRLATVLTEVARVLGVGPGGAASASGAGPATPGRAEPGLAPRLGPSQSLTLDLRQVLLGSSFRLNLNGDASGEADAGAGAPRLTAWGRFAGTTFAGQDGALSLDGDVFTGTVGVDSEWDRLLAGVAVAHSRGDGAFTDSGLGLADRGRGGLEQTLTSLHPYLRYAVTDRLDVWGLVGYGWGELDVELENGMTLETDTNLVMGAFGGRGILLAPEATGGVQLATRTDAMLTRTSAAAAANSAATDADAHRLRVILEGSRAVTWTDGRRLTPTVELGMRHDWGDAETGFGVEVGGRVQYVDPRVGLTVEGAVRGLLAHEDSDYQEWGASGTVRLAPGVGGQGLALTLSPTWGAASSGVEGLWARQTTQGLAPQGMRPTQAGRLQAEVGYGLALFETGLVTPYAGTVLADGADRTYRVGTRLQMTGLTLNLEGTRQEPAGPQPVNQGVRLQVEWGF